MVWFRGKRARITSAAPLFSYDSVVGDEGVDGCFKKEERKGDERI